MLAIELKLRQFSLLAVALYLYLLITGLFYFMLNRITSSDNPTYRMSLQSHWNFGNEPSALAIPISVIIGFAFVFSYHNLIRLKVPKLAIWKLSILMMPSSIILFLLVLQFLLGKLSIDFAQIDLLSILSNAFKDYFWMGIFSFCVSLLVAILFFASSMVLPKENEHNEESLRLISWFIPPIISTSLLLSRSINSNELIKSLLWLFFAAVFSLLVFISFATNKKLKSDMALVMIIFVIVFVNLYFKRPRQLITWRPTFEIFQISNSRFLICALFLGGLAALMIFFFPKNRLLALQATLGGVLYLSLAPWNALLNASTDNFHFGEMVGTWYSAKLLGYSSYNEVEYPRGLLINFIPAEVGNFFSIGFPETYAFWFIILSFFIGVAVTLALRQYIDISLVYALLLVLPKVNGYNEIDILIFLGVISVVSLSKRDSITLSYHVFVGASCWLFIYLVPGQGVIYSLLVLFYLLVFHLYNCLGSNDFRTYLSGQLKNFTVLGSVLFFMSLALRDQILWVLGNSRVSNYMFGDYWLRKAFDPQVFPFSIRFLPILLVPLLLAFYYVYRNKIGITSKIFLVLSNFYMVIISARWFGRVDSGLSRIGVGFMIMLVFLVLPIFSNRPVSFRAGPKFQALTLSLILCLSLGFAVPSLGGSLEPVSPSVLKETIYKGQTDTGLKYQKIQGLVNSLQYADLATFNMTGGDALSLYTGIPGYGGIQSAYTVTNDRQESRWVKRLIESKINFVVGGFEYPFDGSGFGGRAPLALNWLVRNFQPIECGEFQIAIPHERMTSSFQTLNAFKCAVPTSPQAALELWNKMDSTVQDLEFSFQSWKKPKILRDEKGMQGGEFGYLYLDVKGLANFSVDCSLPARANMTLTGMREGQEIDFTFNAYLRTGSYTFNPKIFPISSFSTKPLKLFLEDSACKLVPLN